MSFYKKFTAEDDKLRNVITEGSYQGIVDKISMQQSKSSRPDGTPKESLPMAVVEVVLDVMGKHRRLTDWIMLDGEMAWKFRHFSASAKLLDRYENDTIELSHFVGKQVTAKVIVRDSRDQHGNNVKRNSIQDYLENTPRETISYEFLDSDIPDFK